MPDCGIYSITHAPSGRRYIGQSIDIARRAKVHLSHLRRGKHHCLRMQRAFDRDGLCAFVVEVLETCIPADLTSREQAWMDHCRPTGLYNLSTAADAPRGYVRSAATRAKLSAAHKGNAYSKGWRHTEEAKAKMRAAAIARAAAKPPKPPKERTVAPRRPIADETRQRMREAQARVADIKRQKAREQWNRPGFRELMGATRQGRTLGPETRAKVGAASKQRWDDPAYRERVTASIARANKITGAKNAEHMKKKWADPEFRAAMLARRARR